MKNIIGDSSSAKLSSLLEVVRLTYEEGLELGQLGQLMAATGLDEESGAATEPSNATPYIASSLNAAPVPTSPTPHPPSQPLMVQNPLPPRQNADPSARQSSGSSVSCTGRLLPGGPCESCQATESPQWRRPEPARILLCNRCGIHYGRYKKFPGRKPQDGSSSGVPGAPKMKRKSKDIQSDEEQSRLRPAVGLLTAAQADGQAVNMENPFCHGSGASGERHGVMGNRPSASGVLLPKGRIGMARQHSCPLLTQPLHQPGLKSDSTLMSTDSIDYVLSQGAFEHIMSQGSQDVKSSQDSIAASIQYPAANTEEPGTKKEALQQKLQQMFPPSQAQGCNSTTSASKLSTTAYAHASSLPTASQPPYTKLPPSQHTQGWGLMGKAPNAEWCPPGPSPAQPAEPKQQHYIFRNGMLMAIDGAPADVTAYVSVLGSLMQQQLARQSAGHTGPALPIQGRRPIPSISKAVSDSEATMAVPSECSDAAESI